MSPSDLSLGWSSSRCLLGAGDGPPPGDRQAAAKFWSCCPGCDLTGFVCNHLCPMVQVTRGAPPRNLVVCSCKIQELGSV